MPTTTLDTSLGTTQQAMTIRGVKLQWPGRTIPGGIVSKLEGARVDVDQAAGRRSYRDRIGTLSRVRFDGGVLRADLVLNPAHQVAAQVVWDAEHSPNTLALKVSPARGEGLLNVTLVAVQQPSDGPGLFESIDQSSFTRGNQMGIVRDYMQAKEQGVSVDAFLATRGVAETSDRGHAAPASIQESAEEFARRLRGLPATVENLTDSRRRHAGRVDRAQSFAALQEDNRYREPVAREDLVAFRRRLLAGA